MSVSASRLLKQVSLGRNSSCKQHGILNLSECGFIAGLAQLVTTFSLFLVLLYEPDNPDALSFSQLIDEKLTLGEWHRDSILTLILGLFVRRRR